MLKGTFTNDGKIPFIRFTETGIRKSVGFQSLRAGGSGDNGGMGQGLKTDQTARHHHYVTLFMMVTS